MTQDDGAKNIAIVIVAYNSALEIDRCLQAALLTGAEVLVVDNQSADSTVAIVRSHPVRLIENSENRGFAGAVNQGVAATTAKYILLLNPDAELCTGIQALQLACDLPGIGASAGLLKDLEGKPQAGFSVRRLPTPWSLSFEVLGLNRLFPNNPVNWRFRCFDISLKKNEPIRVEQPAGALFMFRRACWSALGGFDEQFHPLWFEDVDFCARLLKSGEGILLVPEVVAKHAGAHSILNMALEIRHLYWYGNLLKYAAKHFSTVGRQLVSVSVALGAAVRFLIGVPGRNGREPWNRSARVWTEVVRLATRCFFGRLEWDGKRNGGAPAIR